MPLYEYRCSVCGEKVEIIQKSSDTPLKNCPTCGGAMKKLFSPPMLQFKGSGWYVTDYAKRDSGKEKKEEEKGNKKDK